MRTINILIVSFIRSSRLSLDAIDVAAMGRLCERSSACARDRSFFLFGHDCFASRNTRERPEVDEAEMLHFKRAKLVRDSLGVWCTSVNRAVLFSRRLKNSTR